MSDGIISPWVSIHASVKDATDIDFEFSEPFQVSIHASVKDATEFCEHNNYPPLVSIHASVKDATSFSSLSIDF